MGVTIGDNDDLRLGQLYKGLIFSIAVGPEEEIFTAHADVLTQSPVLAELTCEIDNVEVGSIPRIDLPEDDPMLFGCLLEYLYQGQGVHDRWNNEGPPNADDRTVFLADMYILAQKYRLERLLPIAANLLVIARPANYVSFFDIAQRIWASTVTPGYGPFFEQYYYPRVRHYVRVSTGTKWFDDMVLSGTGFGRELYNHMAGIVISRDVIKGKRVCQNDEDPEAQRRMFKKARPSPAKCLESA
ncbi:MAG: hypothetical protein M1830_001020 [Pleopsidium flavum]|nr:MAG: hypothetical protein M1830_001020 [Pleopsidium flavum]